jgi:hypothetical protein
MVGGDWTIDELAQRVADVLTGDGYPGAPNGRVRDVPDPRAIRWYATIGLVDRPSSVRGRAARYGDRHLLQVVAIKRLQARGRSLAEIQAELAGATETTLRTVAQLPAARPAIAVRPVQPGESSTGEPVEPSIGPDTPDLLRRRDLDPSPRRELDLAPGSGAAPAPRTQFWLAPPPATAGPAPLGSGAPEGLLTGVPLMHGAVLLLPAVPSPDDLNEIAAAARPLLDLLAARGLLRSAP